METIQDEIDAGLPLIILDHWSVDTVQKQVRLLLDFGYEIHSTQAVYEPEHDRMTFVVFMVRK